MSRAHEKSGAETASTPENRAAAFSGTVAVLVALAVGLLLGAAHGSLPAVVTASASGLLAALGVRAAQSRQNARRAVGSVGVVTGATGFAGVALFGPSPVALLVGSAVAAAAVNATVSFDERIERPAVRTVWRSAAVLAVGTVLAVGVSTGAFAAGLWFLGGGLVSTVSSNALAMLIALQIEVFLVAELLRWAVPILDRWLPEDRDLRAVTLDRFDFRVEDVPPAYWLAFGLQLVLAFVSWGPRWFAALLDALGVLGRTVELLLFTGVLHLPLAGMILGLVGVLLARAVQAAFVGWAGSDPPRAVAQATGGIVVLAVATLLAVALPQATETLTGLAGGGWAATVRAVGPTATVVGAVAGTLFGVAAARHVLAEAVAPWVVFESASGFAVAGGGLFAAALVVAEAGGSALAAFAGVAGALVVHDLGSNAVGLGAQLGSAAETRSGEAAHAVGSLLVGASGVALAGLTALVMGSVEFSPPAWRARLAVGLLLVAVLCFAVLFERE